MDGAALVSQAGVPKYPSNAGGFRVASSWRGTSWLPERAGLGQPTASSACLAPTALRQCAASEHHSPLLASSRLETKYNHSSKHKYKNSIVRRGAAAPLPPSRGARAPAAAAAPFRMQCAAPRTPGRRRRAQGAPPTGSPCEAAPPRPLRLPQWRMLLRPAPTPCA